MRTWMIAGALVFTTCSCGGGDDAFDGATSADVVGWGGAQTQVGRRKALVGVLKNDAGDLFVARAPTYDFDASQVVIGDFLGTQRETVAQFLVAGDVPVTVHAEDLSAKVVFHVREALAPQEEKHTVSIGERELCFITTNGTSYCYSDDLTTPYTIGTDLIALRGSGYATCMLHADHSVQCTGLDPIDTSTLTNMANFASGRDGVKGWVCGVTLDAQYKCVGSPELYIGLPQEGTKPVSVSSSGRCLLASSGEIVCGATAVNDFEDVGAQGLGGTPTFRQSNYKNPYTPVSGDLFWIQVTDGERFSCGLEADHTAWCWGLLSNSSLGNPTGGQTCGANNSYACIKHPVPVVGGHHFTSLATSDEGYRTCGLEEDGNTYCWGNGHAAGDGGMGLAAEPTLVAGGHKFVEIAVGTRFSCGVTAPGELWCWGALPGQTTDTQTLLPTLVTTPAPIKLP